MHGHVFLSHAGADTVAAKQLADVLSDNGISVWFDRDSLKPGDHWQPAIEKAIATASAMIVYVSARPIARWVDREVRFGLLRNTEESGGFPFIPVLAADVEPEKHLPPFVSQHHCVRLGVDGIGALLAVLRDRPRTAAIAPEHWDGRTPFRSLATFNSEDAWLFFGRNQETDELVSRLGRAPVLTIVGNSGSGKSSLVRAGLLPALQRGRFATLGRWTDSWRIAVCRPSSGDPIQELARDLPSQLGPGLGADDRFALTASLAAQLRQRSTALGDAIAAIVGSEGASPRSQRVLLVIDQFEELFTSQIDEATRSRYVEALLDCARLDGAVPIHVVFVVRSDFIGRCLDVAPLDIVLHSCFRVPPMTRDQLRETVTSRLTIAGGSAEPGLIDAMLADVGSEPGNLALLEHALGQLWERSAVGPHGGQLLTTRAYEQIGRLEGALRQHAERVYARLDEDARLVVQRIFLELVQPGDGDWQILSRRRVAKASLSHLDRRGSVSSGGLVERLLSTLSSERLLSISSDDGSAPADAYVEVSHEALIREWPRIREWVVADLDSLRFKRQLEASTREWESHGDNAGVLLTALQLDKAEAWLKTHEAAGAIVRFVTRSREISDAKRLLDQRTTRRARRFALIAGVLLVVVLGAAGLAIVQRNAATDAKRVALARQLSAEAGLMVQEDPTSLPLATLLMLESSRRERLLETDSSLRGLTGILAEPIVKATVGDMPLAVRLSSDGQRAVSGNATHIGTVTEVATGRVLAEGLTTRGTWLLVRISQDGSTVAGIDDAGQVVVADVATARVRMQSFGNRDVLDMSIDQDGQRLALASERSIRVIDVGDGREIRSIESGPPFGTNITMTPDGRCIIVRSSGFGPLVAFDVQTGRQVLADDVNASSILIPVPFLSIVAVSPDSRRLAIGRSAAGAELLLVELPSGTIRARISTDSVVTAAEFSRDGSKVVFGTTNGSIVTIDAATARELRRRGSTQPLVRMLRQSRDDEHIVAAGDGGIVSMIDQTAGEVLGLVFNETPVIDIAVNEDRTFTVADEAGVVRVVRPAREPVPVRFRAPLSGMGTRGWIVDNGKRVVISGGLSVMAKPLTFFEGNSGALELQPALPDGFSVASISQDGTVVAGRHRDSRFSVLRVADNRESLALPADQAISFSLLSPDGRLLLTYGKDKVARLHDIASGGERWRLELETTLSSAAFSRDVERLVIATGTVVRVVRVSTGVETTAHTAQEEVRRVAFTADGTKVVLAAGDQIQMIDASVSATLLSVPIGAPVSLVALSEDAVWIAASSGNAVRLIDVRAGKPVSRMDVEGEVEDMRFSADSRDLLLLHGRIIGGLSAEFNLTSHRVLARDVIDSACKRVLRNMTAQEWLRFLGSEPYRLTCPAVDDASN